ncbi:phosphotransferase family protein [Pseudonocardia lacus]|uniref:phosphotransferase family protein n=1 Tax=Pseudonocardia lacus TaxID=2835865 RepID=UPI001BDD216B|nr:aminoglycoside phosphotransferase family protein [Pseudonocardia lacus]
MTLQARPPGAHELAVAEALLPGTALDGATVVSGGSHDVVRVPGVAAVRIARSAPAVESLARRSALLVALARAGLPFAVPEPLGPVTSTAGWTAVAVSWVPGREAPRGEGDPDVLRGVLDALAGVDLAPLECLLDVPHAYAGRERWEELMLDVAVPLLPERLRASARRRIAEAVALEPVPPRLVHGDLAGENMHWSEDGRLLGVIDWDLAHAFDPAVDVACLAFTHGWPVIGRTVDARTYERARVWAGTFPIEQLVKYRLDGVDDTEMDRWVANVTRWMDVDGHG